MKTKHIVNLALCLAVLALGIFFLLRSSLAGGIPPALIGLSLVYLSLKRNRAAQLVFGHFTVIIGCFYVTWGLYLLPYSEPDFSNIVGKPLFWGLFSIFGGICALYHGFCRCLKEKV